jgi:hypothetical protein
MRICLPPLGQIILGILFAVVLLAGPAFVLFFYHAGWAAGYRLEDWGRLEGVSVFRLFPLIAFLWCPSMLMLSGFLVVRTARGWKARSRKRNIGFIVASLLVMLTFTATITSLFGFARRSKAFEKGREAVEMEIGLERLAKASLALYQQMPETETIVTDSGHDPSLPPPIQRLIPTWVAKWPGKLHIELHGGFDHYGYELQLDAQRRVWVLLWVTENSEEEQLTIPAD